MNSKILIEENFKKIAEKFSQLLIQSIESSDAPFYLVLSGGSTPKNIFDYIAENYNTKIDWRKVKLFWGDERCVPPDNTESNFKTAFDSLISKINIPEENIFRIQGELEPNNAAENYSASLLNNVPLANGFPQFDLIMLGLGEDGHIASIFPENLDLFQSKNICDITRHPLTGQSRITMTGSVINNAKKIVFLVTSSNKSIILDTVINKRLGWEILPAAHVRLSNDEIFWLADFKAGKFLS